MTKNFENLKIASFITKIAKNCDIKKLKTIPWPEKFLVTYYQTLKEFSDPLSRKNVNNDKKYPNNWKKFAIFVKKMLKYVMLHLETIQ